MSWCAVFPDCDVPQGMGVSPPVGQVRTHCALTWRYNGAVLCAFGDCRLLIHGGLRCVGARTSQAGRGSPFALVLRQRFKQPGFGPMESGLVIGARRSEFVPRSALRHDKPVPLSDDCGCRHASSIVKTRVPMNMAVQRTHAQFRRRVGVARVGDAPVIETHGSSGLPQWSGLRESNSLGQIAEPALIFPVSPIRTGGLAGVPVAVAATFHSPGATRILAAFMDSVPAFHRLAHSY